VYYNKTYQAVPEKGGEKAFEVLRTALFDEQKIAIGKTVLGTKDTLMALIPREDGMLISTMFYEDDIKELQKTYKKPELSEQELAMAKTLINTMDTEFNPSDYSDEYQKKLRELIETKISGKEVVAPKQEGIGNVINLMDALKASVEKAKKVDTDEKAGSEKEKAGAVSSKTGARAGKNKNKAG
jgi:DNA end-binding protein Ku